MMNVVVAETGINDTNVGSAIRSIVESAAMSDFKSQSSIIAVLNSQDIDRATGSDLDKIGKAAGVDRPQAKSSSGLVTIGSSSFTKISTKVYAGTAAPPAGSNTINISDGSRFPNTGSIYIGRGTSNLEGPIPYSSVSQVGNYFQLTLSSPTTKNHNISESVILAQGGNRVVSAGAVVQTKANDTNPSVKFTVINNVTVPDGEESVSGVPVAATQPGTVGNVAANSVVEFASTSFPAAFVTNPTAFISGRDQLSDRDYRDLIKKSAQNKTKGTPQAIESASIGVISTDDNKTVTSAKVRPSPNREEPAILFLDDGTAYQPLIFGQGFEPVVDNAAGSEKFLQLQHEDITRATLISTFSTPFALTADMTLAVKVGGVLSEHIFQSTDFATQLAADTFEVVNSINQNTSLLFSARALANSQRVAIFAKSFKNEDVKVVPPSIGTNANDFIGLSTNLTYSLRLYKNDELLYKDGVIPTALSIEQADWNAIAFVNGATLQFAVDGTPTQTVTFLDADFVPFGYTTVSAGNSLESFVSIINSKAAGLTATVLGNQIKVVSNKDNNDSASLEVVGGTLVTSGNMFDAAFSQGQSSDYALNRATGQVELSNVLSAGDILTAGSRNTRGFVDSGSFSTNAVSFVTTVNDPTPKLYFVVDAPAERVSAGVTTGSGITVTNPSSTNWVYTSSVGSAFTNVLPGDWALIVSKNIPDSSNNKGFWRVTASTASSFTVQKVAGTATAYVAASNDDIIFIRSDAGIQQVNLGTGTQTLGAVAANITSALVGGFAIVQSAKKVRVFTNTFASSGSMFMAGMNDPAKVLEFTVASFDLSDVSHTAFVESDNSELTIPDFLHDYVTANNSVLPPPVIDRTLTTNATLSTYIPPNRVLSFLDAYSRVCNNEDLYSMIASISGTTVVIRGNNRMRDIITNDRYFTASSFNFSGEDNLVVIIDKDAVNKSLNIQMYRNGTVSSQTPPTLSTFTAYDTDLSVTGNWPQSFGDNFDFEDFKVLFKSRQILDPSGANNAMLLRHVKYGSTGDQYRVGLFYPVTPSSGMSHTISVGELTKVKVALASDVSKVGSWAAGSQFNVTNPVGNTYRYSHNGTGPAPNFTTALPSPIVPGDIVTVSSSSPFSIGNEGTFRVTAVTSLYFEVTNASGVVESNIQLNNVNDFLFYALDATFNTANAIAEYVNSNMPDHLFVSQLESGVGVATTSTFEDTASEYVSLVDGENWLSSSNIGTTSTPLNQFVLKVPRQLADSVSPPYSIVGEMFRVVPTMADHVSRFLNRFAVTGLSSLANLNTSSRAGKVQVYSNLFGSNGAVQVGGGTANKIDAAAQSSGNIVDTTFTKFNINTSDSLGIMAGQWVKVTNTNVQAKSVVFGSSSQLQITPNSPTTGFSQVDIANTSYSIVALTGAVRLSNVVTITTTTPHSFSVDQTVTIASVTNASFNGTFLVTSTPTTTTFTYSQVAANATSGGGTATGPFGLGTFQVPRSHSGDATTEVRFERQAQFVCLSWTGTGTAPNFLGGGVREGDWVVVGGSSIDVLNQGTFKVVKLFGSNTLYIENNNAVKENVVLSASSDLRFYSYDSVMPGDEFVVSGDALGSSNNGSFTVVSSTSPSIPFPTPNTIYVVGIMTAFGPASLGTGASEVKVNEDVPLTLYKRIANVAVDPNDPADFNVVVETTELGAKINTDAGSFISLVSRLDFNTMVNVGEDSYKFYGGLIHATGVVIRGSQSDPITYPGVAATGSYIEIDAALPKRIRLSIVIRNITGTPFTVLKTRVQNVVSAYVNSLGVNQSVVFSQIVSVANSVDGVQAVAISSPLYDATHDLITVQPNEKPVIVDVNADIIVSLPT
jgi:hypothetical protein